VGAIVWEESAIRMIQSKLVSFKVQVAIKCREDKEWVEGKVRKSRVHRCLFLKMLIASEDKDRSKVIRDRLKPWGITIIMEQAVRVKLASLIIVRTIQLS
jgi:hypothetical protein